MYKFNQIKGRVFVMLLISLLALSCQENLDKDNTYCFVGDSIIARWPIDETLPSQMVYNHGRSGAGIAYIKELTNRFNGNDVVVMIGTNDNYHFYSDDIDSYVETYLGAISKLTDKNIYLYSVLPREFVYDNPDINDKICLFNKKVKNSLADYPRIIYIDVFDEFLYDGHINYQYYSDGLHLNGYGYEILSTYFLMKSN